MTRSAFIAALVAAMDSANDSDLRVERGAQVEGLGTAPHRVPPKVGPRGDGTSPSVTPGGTNSPE